jgi:hypothetical protein
MRTTKHFIVMLLCVLLYAPTALAQQVQDKQHDAQTNDTVSQDVMIIIQQEKVRFTAQKAVAEMQLKVFDQSSELIYDSGATPEPELNWPLRNANGKAVKSGLYAYQLSIKEAGAEAVRLRRGQLIVDRAKERDGQTDRLLITSQQDSGVGTELTVARNEGVTIAGTSAASAKVSGTTRETTRREGEATAEAPSANNNDLAAVGVISAGTAGQIAKFISAFELGDSVITELNGKIGIGTANPLRTLQIGPSADAAFTFEPADASPNAGYIRFGDRTGWKLHFGRSRESSRLNGAPLNTGTTGVLMTLQDNGNVGIGTMAPDTPLHIFGQSARVKVQAAPLNDTTQDNVAFVLANRGAGGAPYTWVLTSAAVGGGFGVNPNALEIWEYPQDATPGCCLPRLKILPSGNQGSAPSPVTIMGNGGLQTSMLQILGGSDLAEPFEISEADLIRPGLVVAIDPDRPGQLRMADKAYDRTVAGIISGANGINPGLTMKQAGSVIDGAHPVALTGRVYCWADASYGPIEPGDLLTTSDTPGHAMKVTDHAKAQGAIIGKAMTELKQGKGLVLVLVTLQ